jgi:hypothetical protein
MEQTIDLGWTMNSGARIAAVATWGWNRHEVDVHALVDIP